jgi:hypothetical protein
VTKALDLCDGRGHRKGVSFSSASEVEACVHCTGMFSLDVSCNADVLYVKYHCVTVGLLTAVKAEIIRFVQQ